MSAVVLDPPVGAEIVSRASSAVINGKAAEGFAYGALTLEELASRLNAEAARRGITVDALIDELAGKVVEPEAKPVKRRLAFVGIGASTSGRGVRKADEMLAEGFGRPSAC